MENLIKVLLEVRLDIIMFFLDKLESLKKTFNDDQFSEFRSMLQKEKVLVENQLMK